MSLPSVDGPGDGVFTQDEFVTGSAAYWDALGNPYGRANPMEDYANVFAHFAGDDGLMDSDEWDTFTDAVQEYVAEHPFD